MASSECGAYVPTSVETCPECGSELWVYATEWDVETGRPTEIEINCVREEDAEAGKLIECRTHQHTQDKWQPVMDSLRVWGNVLDDGSLPSEVDTWNLKTEHDDDPFQSDSATMILESLHDKVDDWMRSSINNGETLTITVQYRSVDQAKYSEWKKHGLI